MKINENLGFILLGVWLIAVGALSLLSITFAYRELILGLVALAAGILIIFGK